MLFEHITVNHCSKLYIKLDPNVVPGHHSVHNLRKQGTSNYASSDRKSKKEHSDFILERLNTNRSKLVIGTRKTLAERRITPPVFRQQLI